MTTKNLNRLKIAAFRNAIRLFRDACLIAGVGSNETAFAIAVLAYEEIGKVALADRKLDDICLNGGAESHDLSNFAELSRKHITKQGWAAFDSGNHDLQGIQNLDNEKQRALYTDISHNGVHTPSISKARLDEMIREVYRALQGIGDLAYSGVHACGTSKSEWQAQEDIKSVKDAYEKAIGL